LPLIATPTFLTNNATGAKPPEAKTFLTFGRSMEANWPMGKLKNMQIFGSELQTMSPK